MTTITTTETVETVQRLPIEAIVPDPGNRKADPDAQFVASVRTHGVIQPLLVTPHAEDASLYRLVAGERRLRAAKKAGHDTVPAIVRTLSDQEILEHNLIENIQRQGIKPTHEALAMARLVEIGMSQKVLAKRIGRSAAYVRERLRLIELPPGARRLVDDEVIGIEAGVALVQLVDHPEAMESALAQVGTGRRDVEWLVSSTLRQLEAEAKVAEARAKAEAEGLHIVEHEGYQPKGYVEVGTYGGLDVDPKAHAKEPCHAVAISPRDATLTPVCTDKKRHSRKGTSSVKTAPKQGPDHDARAEKAARKQATDQRKEFIASVLAGRISKADVLALVLPNYLDDANANEQQAIAKLLGVEPPDDNRYNRWGHALREYAAASETARLRACLAFSLVQGEEAVSGSWGHDRAERHRAFLAAKGYEPTAYEVEQAEAAARRHEESLARTAEFRAQVASAEDAVAEPADDDDGTSGQDRESYTDTQDRDSYTTSSEPCPDDPAEANGHDEEEGAFDDAG